MKVKSVQKLIKNELLTECKECKLKTIKCNANGESIELVDLTPENVKKVESMLKYNPDYPQFIDFNGWDDNDFDKLENKVNEEMLKNKKIKKEQQEFKYVFTYYLATLLKLEKENKLDKDLYNYLIYAILRRISSENSTRTKKEAVLELANNVCNEFPTLKILLEALKEPYEKNSYDECEYKLIKCISKKTKTDGKRNFSLATKFCHYMNFNIYLKTECVDLFSIYDNVVKDNLHYYYNYYVNGEKQNIGKKINCKYNLDRSKLNDDEIIDIYREYQSMIDEIISKTKISRNGFDHLVWYTNKK